MRFYILGCGYRLQKKEPVFIVTGNAGITKDIKINIEIIKDNETVISTVYYNGKSYDIDNYNSIRYIIYMSYKDSFFFRLEMDNLHGKIKGEPMNEIVIEKKDGLLKALYRPLKESDTIGASTSLLSNAFFADVHPKDIEKQKFTTFYRIKNH